ncbi:hypothetical protein LCGC14_2078660 [marine sediment metagenome]|uniref:Uncharacterized protein n=1 Tax=marine sediment metagenome TaxID=412755 RepID=A0A0F9EG40_9ZZZZ
MFYAYEAISPIIVQHVFDYLFREYRKACRIGARERMDGLRQALRLVIEVL